MAINVLKEAPDKVALALSGMGAETIELIIREHRAEIDLLRAKCAALEHGLRCIAEQPTWTDHAARAAGVLRQVELIQ